MISEKSRNGNTQTVYRRPGVSSADQAIEWLYPDRKTRQRAQNSPSTNSIENISGHSRTQYVDIDKLKIDYLYQRMDVSQSNIRKIAKNWDWGVYTNILVSERDNGDLVVVDGQHRLLAAHEHGGIKQLKCEIYRYGSISDEARAFFNANQVKKSVSAYSKYISSLVYNDPVAIAAKDIAYKYGYSIDHKRQKGSSYVGISQLLRIVKINRESAEYAFRVCAYIANNEYFESTLLSAVNALYNKFKDDERFVNSDWEEKLRSAGVKLCKEEMARMRNLYKGGGQAVDAIALLDIINKSKRKKFVWPV